MDGLPPNSGRMGWDPAAGVGEFGGQFVTPNCVLCIRLGFNQIIKCKFFFIICLLVHEANVQAVVYQERIESVMLK